MGQTKRSTTSRVSYTCFLQHSWSLNSDTFPDIGINITPPKMVINLPPEMCHFLCDINVTQEVCHYLGNINHSMLGKSPLCCRN